jgi:hypothetical protein
MDPEADPQVKPLGLDGTPLPVEGLVTLELEYPGYVTVEPGQISAGWFRLPPGG